MRLTASGAMKPLIHVPEDELPGILEKLTEALCQNGILFLSFQEGDFEGQRSGRYFCEYTRKNWSAF